MTWPELGRNWAGARPELGCNFVSGAFAIHRPERRHTNRLNKRKTYLDNP